MDHGFRVALEMLEDIGLQSNMPCFMKKNQKQMSPRDANASRLVTKIN